MRTRIPGTVLFLSFVAFLFVTSGCWSATSVTCASPATRPQAGVEYFVSLAEPANHVAHVSIRFQAREGKLALDMPVWNALYQVRDFAVNVMDVRAQDASAARLPVVNTSPSEWEVTTQEGCVVVSYDIHLAVPGPFGSSLDEQHGFFNWAMVLMYAPALRNQPVSVRLLDVPPTWALRDLHVLGVAAPGQVEKLTGIAQNYDELADSPAELGAFWQVKIQADGATYHVVVGPAPVEHEAIHVDVLGKIAQAAVDWMQDRPYDEYTFIYHVPHGPAAGAMEHAYGAVIDISADHLGNPYALASVTAHEFFHLWNVKRIRPQSFEPIDYQHAQDTRSLWFCEGVTDTVARLLLVRAGLINEASDLRDIADGIAALEHRPARLWQSVEESGVDAWFENKAFYRSPERSISYYNKGDIVGVLLDLRIRQLTDGRKSLRDLFQWMNEHYAKQHRFYPGSLGVQEAAETVSGHSFAEFFRDYVAGVKPIPYDDSFRFVGLQLVNHTVQVAATGFVADSSFGTVPQVASVQPGSNAQRAGILAGDRVVAVNGRPADRRLNEQLQEMAPGTVVQLQLENSRGKRQVSLQLGSREETVYELLDLPVVTAEQRAHRAAWIRGDDEPGSPTGPEVGPVGVVESGAQP